MIEFHLDQFSAGFLAGWTRGPADKPLVLNLSINDSLTIIGKEAGIYRSDLHGAGIGSGCFGFCFILDAAMDNGSRVEITDFLSGEILFSGEF